MSAPKIEPNHANEYTVKQSKYQIAGKLQLRNINLGPSGNGKTVRLQNVIVDMYSNCFERNYIFSPTIDVDSSWLPVNKSIEM